MTEQEISTTWRKLFKNQVFNSDIEAKAEALLDELRPESPLRHRLSTELDEIRKLCSQN